jgi:trk system potassium uptake protein TrkA
LNVLVIGAGEVGSHLARFLTKEAHAVTVVDRNVEALQRTARATDVQTIEGHGASYPILIKAGAGKADLVVAVTSNDELNMVACTVAKRLGARRTVVRVHAAQDLQDNQFVFKDILGFDLIISPEEMAALEILRVCRGQNAAPVENFAGGRLQMRRLEILADSPSSGRSFAQLKMPSNVLATGVLRGTEVTIPRGDFTLAAGDYVMLLGAPDGLDRAEKVLGGRRDLPRRVLISGGGPIARLVARDLTTLGVKVRLIEATRLVAEQLSRDLEGAEVVHGAGTDMEILNQEGVHRAAFFISLTPLDEVNILACQLARSLGADKTIALVNRSDYAALVNRLGVDHAVSPRRLVARRIAQYVRGASEGSIAQIHHGAAEVLDRIVETGWRYVGRPLAEIPFPSGSVVGGILRAGATIIPKGDTSPLEGDHLIVFAKREVLPDLNRLFALRGAPPGESLVQSGKAK